ncbi:MAG: hypothetical protein KGO23_01630, partial [Nitrospirota bacterium]|nr:hypothetical protein [Nitrospirota bacterium]
GLTDQTTRGATTYSYREKLSILNVVVGWGNGGKPVDNCKRLRIAISQEFRPTYPQSFDR